MNGRKIPPDIFRETSMLGAATISLMINDGRTDEHAQEGFGTFFDTMMKREEPAHTAKDDMYD